MCGMHCQVFLCNWDWVGLQDRQVGVSALHCYNGAHGPRLALRQYPHGGRESTSWRLTSSRAALSLLPLQRTPPLPAVTAASRLPQQQLTERLWL